MRTIEHGHQAQSRGNLGSVTWWGICSMLLASSGCSAGTIEPLPALPEYSYGWVIADAGRGPDASASVADTGVVAQPDCAPTAASLREDVFAPRCTSAGCHGAVHPAAALDLTRIDFSTLLVNQTASSCDGRMLVVPGKPADSLLMAKLAHTLPADCGAPMPPVGEALSQAQQACVRDWIAALPTQTCEQCGGATCVSLAEDEANCGACGTQCPSRATCEAGRCQCADGLTDCDGTCVDLTRTDTHCGSCGDACPDGAACSLGECLCAGGLTRCGDACVELATDPMHCLSCGVQCGAGELCTPTGCKRATSCGGLESCGGACVDTQTSVAHCGGCDVACGAGRTCSAGSCTCDGGTSACGGGCVDASSDPHNCGGCGIACGSDQACVQGACTCTGPVVSFADDVAPILERRCTNAGCHVGATAKAQLNLALDKSYAELVGVTTVQCSDGRLLVEPGRSSDSYLMQKMVGTNMCAGTLMPKAASALPTAELDIIASWICQGAQP